MRYTRKLNVPTIATLSNLLRNTAVLLEAVSWLIVQPDECSLRFLFLLLEHFVAFCLDGGDGFLAVPIEYALQLWMGLELGSVRYVLCLSFSSFRLVFFPWVQEFSIRAALWFWILQEPAVVNRQQTNSKESCLRISHNEKKQSPFPSDVFFPSRRNSSYEWNSSAQVVRDWHSQSAKAVWWWEMLGVLNWKYCSVAMINADWVVYLLKTRFRQSGQPI